MCYAGAVGYGAPAPREGGELIQKGKLASSHRPAAQRAATMAVKIEDLSAFTIFSLIFGLVLFSLGAGALAAYICDEDRKKKAR